MIRTMEQLLAGAARGGKVRLACAAAQDAHTLEALSRAEAEGLIRPILIGDPARIDDICRTESICFSNAEIVSESDSTAACRTAVSLVREGKADFLMKGLVESGVFLRAILNKENGLACASLLNHVMVFDAAPAYDRLLITTDGGMVIAPDLEKKAAILRNTLAVARAFGTEQIHVSVLCAKEKVDPHMPATLDAAELKTMGERGEFGGDVYVEGPIAMDLAMSREAARIKGFDSPVCGATDIALVPNIEAGNLMGKTFSAVFGAKNAGVVMGASVPAVMPSRADSSESKLCSIALGCLIAQKARK